MSSKTWFFDLQVFYAFSFFAPVENKPVPGYLEDSKETHGTINGQSAERAVVQSATYGLPIWKRVVTGTTITLGCNNVFDHDPPKANTTTNYADFLYDSTGRFVCLSLTKKF